MTDPAVPAAAPAPADFPGKTLGIVGLVLAILFPLIGAIVSGVALSQSKNAGYPNGLAKAGLIVGIILTALGVLFTILWFAIFAAAMSTGTITTY